MFPPAGSRLHADHRLGESGASPLPQPRLPCTPSVYTFRLHPTCTPSAYTLSVCTLRVRLPRTLSVRTLCVRLSHALSVHTFRARLPRTLYVHILRARLPHTLCVHTLRPRSLDHAPAPVLGLIAILGASLVATSSSTFSVRNVLSNLAPRDEPRAIAVIPPPFSWPFANLVHRGQMPQSTLAHLRGTFRTRRRLLPLFCAIAPVVTLLHLNPVVTLVRRWARHHAYHRSRHPTRLLFPSSRP